MCIYSYIYIYICIYIYIINLYIYYINLCANRIACVCYFMLADYNEVYRERYVDIDIINRYMDI